MDLADDLERTVALFNAVTIAAAIIEPNVGCTGVVMSMLQIYQGENLFTRTTQTGSVVERTVHESRDKPHVIETRNYGWVAGVELEPVAGPPGARAFGIYLKRFERGLLLRTTGDIIAISPALVIEQSHIDELFAILSRALKE